MGVEINHSRVKGDKPKSTFGKKPYAGRRDTRNRKGSKKISADGSAREPLNSNKPVRFSEAKYKARQEAIRELGVCQICEESCDLDAPHHVEQGGCKDDRYLINACVICHGLIHSVGYSAVKKDRQECKKIAWNNHKQIEGI